MVKPRGQQMQPIIIDSPQNHPETCVNFNVRVRFFDLNADAPLNYRGKESQNALGVTVDSVWTKYAINVTEAVISGDPRRAPRPAAEKRSSPQDLSISVGR